MSATGSSNKDVKIAPGAIVCLESKLKGVITIGSMTVVHPKASIIADAGPIVIGENNIIEEQATIIYTSQDEEKKENVVPLAIGVNNVFEVGCEIHAKAIGDHNVFESKCFVGPNVKIGNGCIIGAGCRITATEKLQDQTVITGRDCVRSVALDKPPAPDDLVRQHDELTVLSEIFLKEEFTNYSKSTEPCAIFEAHLPLQSRFLLLLPKDMAQREFPVGHLPPIQLVATLPQDYPSQNSPYFTLSCCWLSKSKLDLLVIELEKLWEVNHSEILFIWFLFLRDQSLEYLKINDGYDLSEKCQMNFGVTNPNNKVKRTANIVNENSKHCDQITNASKSKGAKEKREMVCYKSISQFCPEQEFGNTHDPLRIESKENLVKKGYELMESYHCKEAFKQLYCYLLEYNTLKTIEHFNKAMQSCNICLSDVQGVLCNKLNCGHVSCTECLLQMCEVHIKYGSTESLVCAQENCGVEIPVSLIRDLVSKELFDQFDQIMLNKTLDNISNMTYCPRIHCQYPISNKSDDGLAVCPNCEHAFCIFCKRPYHAVEGCKLQSHEKKELIEAYQKGTYEEKLKLEKRYSKKQLTELVSTAQSEQWMMQNSKKCPCCHVNIEKNYGCNKIICWKCQAHFCWLCLTRLPSVNPYAHFQDPRSKCFNLLIEVVEEENNEDFEGDENNEVIEGDENNEDMDDEEAMEMLRF